MEFKIGDRGVGGENPCFVIAEACDNHFGSTERAIEMARLAKLAGADCVKFQHHLADEEMLPDVPMSDNFDMPLYEFLKQYALTLEQHRQIKAACDDFGITYLCTPFSRTAADEVETLGVSAYKIGSGEMTDLPTLKHISKFGKPMLVSTGMSTFEEIDRTYELLVDLNVELCLLNCVSEYPPDYEDVNLGLIPIMKERYKDAVIGHSDHTPDLYTSFGAVTLGAAVVEKHVILDKREPGPDQSVSIDFTELSSLVDGIRKIQAGMGASRKVNEKESAIRDWALRSLVTTRPIAKGDEITAQSIWSKRPGTGIPASEMDSVIGKVATRDLESNVMLAREDFE